MADVENIRTRVEHLRDRIRLPQAPRKKSQFEELPLDERMRALQARFLKESDCAAEVSLVEQAEAIDLKGKFAQTPNRPQTDESQALSPDSDIPADLSPLTRTFLGKFREQLVGFRELDGKPRIRTGIGSPERVRTARYRSLVELALRTIYEIGSAPGKQGLGNHPGLEEGLGELAEHLEGRLAEVRDLVERHRSRAELIDRLGQIHKKLLLGEFRVCEELREISRTVIQRSKRACDPFLPMLPTQAIEEMIAEHSYRTASIVAYLGSGEFRDREFFESLIIAALVQDVGMLELPEKLLKRINPLTREQRLNLEQHPIQSAKILEQLPGIDESLARAAAAHHERLDGSGYPDGQTGPQIGEPAKLLAVADVYAAMRSPRFHRSAHSAKTTLTHVLTESEAGRLETTWARRLLNLSLYPVGTVAELATGEIAEVVASQEAADNPHLAALPIVRILKDAGSKNPGAHLYRNLAQCPDSRIVLEMRSV